MHIDWIIAIAIDRTEQYIITGSHDRSVQIIDILQKKVIRTLYNIHESK